ncbi:MAG: M23 family metallopeptidase, partial [Methylococcales bacterium]
LDHVSVNAYTATPLYSLSQPLDLIFKDDKFTEQMDGIVSGPCVYGGYCARSSRKIAHNGVDYAVAKKSPVYALCDGVVKKAVKGGAIASRFTVIDHSGCGGFNRLFAYYGHIDPLVKPGAPVTAGQKIGTVANWKANSHLHLSLNVNYVKQFGYTNIKKPTAKNCKQTWVQLRRNLLNAKGWLDPILIGTQADWLPALLKGGTAKTGCAATEQAYTDKSLPYSPWK